MTYPHNQRLKTLKRHCKNGCKHINFRYRFTNHFLPEKRMSRYFVWFAQWKVCHIVRKGSVPVGVEQNESRRNVFWNYYMTNKITYCGFAAIIGRPNVGKSTLLNDLLGFKLSITSAKPQTTRHRLLGIATEDPYQWIFVDTPGLHQSAQRALNRYLNRAALRTLHDVDVIVLVIDCTRWTTDDEWVLSHLKKIKIPVILAVNKIDKLQQRSDLLPLLKTFEEKYPFKTVVPISARLGEQVMLLKEQIKKYLPESPYLFEEDQVSDRSLPFIVAEMIREKLMRHLEKELPYSLTVTIEAFIEEPDLVRVSAVIWVEKESHKPIVIGKGGDQLRKIGKLARRDIEQYFQKQAYVQLWVKVKPGWTDDEKMLRQLGYDDER